MICPKCGSFQTEDSVFCDECGTSLKAAPRKKHKKLWLALISIVLVVSITAGLVLWAPWNADGTTDPDRDSVQEPDPVPSGTSDTSYSPPSALSLGISESRFLVGEESTVTVTVTCDSTVTEAVSILDEKGNVLTILENDGSGTLAGEITISAEEPVFGSLTAQSGIVSSMEMPYWVTPEVTEAQFQILTASVCDLSAAVAERNFDDNNSPEARAFVMEWLENDPRISGYSEHGNLILFTTIDNLVGGYCGTEMEENTLGSSLGSVTPASTQALKSSVAATGTSES